METSSGSISFWRFAMAASLYARSGATRATATSRLGSLVRSGSRSCAAAAAQDLEPLLTSEPRRDVAVALVAPLLAYKLAAMANRQKLMLPLDVSIALAGAAAVYYCLP